MCVPDSRPSTFGEGDLPNSATSRRVTDLLEGLNMFMSVFKAIKTFSMGKRNEYITGNIEIVRTNAEGPTDYNRECGMASVRYRVSERAR